MTVLFLLTFALGAAMAFGYMADRIAGAIAAAISGTEPQTAEIDLPLLEAPQTWGELLPWSCPKE